MTTEQNTAEFLAALTALCRKHDLWITTDDAPELWPSQEPGDNEKLYYELQSNDRLTIKHADQPE